ncbi:MAG: ECF transporter S component, partial [Anaerotignum sp.]|nr:ECF transporter S component [Anaerotignum sp.]
LIAGLIYGHSKQKSTASLYIALISAMILGRVVWGIVEVLLLGIGENAFTWQMFLSGALLEAIPGIILQLILIPGILVALHRSGHFPL